MSQVHNTAGTSYTQIDIGGKTYTMRPFSIEDYLAAIESHIVASRNDPLIGASRACRVAPAEQHAAIWDAAMRAEQNSRNVSTEEIARFESSLDGIGFKFWRLIYKDHPETTSKISRSLVMRWIGEKTTGINASDPDAVREAQQSALMELHRRLHVASGEAELKKSNGQPQKEVAEEQVGQRSTAS